MTPIAPHITAFLRERLTCENTRATYAYTFQLLFAFASERLGVTPSDLQVEQIDAQLVLAFLDHIQHERTNSARTRNARLAAEMAHCRLEQGWVSRTRPGLPNHAFAALTWRNLARVGGPVMPEAAKRFAREIQSSLGLEPLDEPFLAEVTELIDPQEAERRLRAMMQADVDHFTNDDYVEYTWHTPTVRFFVGRPMLGAPEPGFRYPDWAMNALGGFPAAIDPMTAVAGRTIASTAIDLLTEPAHLHAIRAEFDHRTGGGIGGSDWLAPLFDANTPPPIDYRWPEYVTTARGEEWCIPVQGEGIERIEG